MKMTSYLRDNMWLGKRCFIVGGGPSLKDFDWSLLEGELTIACNLAFEAFDPSMVLAVDKRFYQWILWGEYEEKHPGLRDRFLKLNVCKFLVYPVDGLGNFYTGIDCIPRADDGFLSTTLAEGVSIGGNTGFAAINLATLLGATKIYLLGFDMKGEGGKQAHFHAGHPTKQSDACYGNFLQQFDKYGAEMAARSEIINLNPDSALECFRKGTWETEGIEPIKRPLIVNYHTDDGYKQEAEEMERTARLFGLKPYMQTRKSVGGWTANCYHKVDFLEQCLERFDQPMVWIDADSRFRRYPQKLDDFAACSDLDMAICYIDWARLGKNRSKELISCTLGIRRTPRAHQVISGWREYLKEHKPTLDQVGLQNYLATPEAPNISLQLLPMSYCQIFDLMSSVGEPVIEQTQASRRLKFATHTPPAPTTETLSLARRRETPLHVLVTGVPKSGTSLLYNMLCYAYPHYGHWKGEHGAMLEKDLVKSRISKNPFDLLTLDEIGKAYKQVGKELVVFCVLRDFRDVVTSKRKGMYCISMDSYTNKAGHGLPGVRALVAGLEAGMRSDDVFCVTLQYEHLVKNTIWLQNIIGTFMKEDGVEYFGNFYKSKKLGMPYEAQKCYSPVTQDWIGRWKKPEHRERVLEQFKAQEDRDLLVRYGFARDDEWYAQLLAGSNVVPVSMVNQFRFSAAATKVIQIGQPVDGGFELIEERVG